MGVSICLVASEEGRDYLKDILSYDGDYLRLLLMAGRIEAEKRRDKIYILQDPLGELMCDISFVFSPVFDCLS